MPRPFAKYEGLGNDFIPSALGCDEIGRSLPAALYSLTGTTGKQNPHTSTDEVCRSVHIAIAKLR